MFSRTTRRDIKKFIHSTIRAIGRHLKRTLKRNHDTFLKTISGSGVIHIGANIGQERACYNDFDLKVLWVEPIPEVFAELQSNIQGYTKQRAVQALVTDIDCKEYEFHISNNRGESSSIFELSHHRDIWPHVHYTTTISVMSITLPSLLQREHIDPRVYRALILDTQGSELLVLQGSVPVLKYFQFIKTEVPDFESYKGCCQLSDLSDFLTAHGYKEFSRSKFADRPEGGSYFDVVFQRID